MARIRTIKPRYWDDVKVGKISRDARLLFIGMWTFADDLGVIVAEPVWLKSKIFPYDPVQLQQFERWLDELVKNGFISLLSHRSERFYYLPSFVRHQLINRPNKDDVNIRKEELDGLLGVHKQSVTDNPCAVTDASLSRVIKEGKGEEGEDTPSGDGSERLLSDYDKFNAWLRENTPNVLRIQRQISEPELLRLKAKYNTQQIMNVLGQIDNYKTAVRKYTSVYRTFLNWAKKEYGN